MKAEGGRERLYWNLKGHLMCDIESKVKSSVVLDRSQFQEIVSILKGFADESFVIKITESRNNISIFRRWFYIHYSGY